MIIWKQNLHFNHLLFLNKFCLNIFVWGAMAYSGGLSPSIFAYEYVRIDNSIHTASTPLQPLFRVCYPYLHINALCV